METKQENKEIARTYTGISYVAGMVGGIAIYAGLVDVIPELTNSVKGAVFTTMGVGALLLTGLSVYGSRSLERKLNED